MKMKINNKQIKSLFLLSLLGSSLGQEEKSTNQTEIAHSNGLSFNSLPEMGTNFTKRGNETDPIRVFAGMPMFLRGNSASNQNIDQRRCVSSFALVLPEAGNCQWQGFKDSLNNSGFITSARCCQSGNCGANFVLLLENNSQNNIGQVAGSTFFYTGSFTDQTFVLTHDEGLHLIPYVMGEEEVLLPIIGLGSATLGSDVCAYGATSGYFCGKVVEMDASLEIPNPTEGGNITIISLNKVDLGEKGFEYEEDIGGPVYTVSNIGDRTVAQALGHISNIDYSDSQHKSFYYTPLDKVLEDMFNYDGCAYNLLTYNKTNSQEYDQLLAQVEIPAKK